MQPAKDNLVRTWCEYQTQFGVVQQSHRVAKTVMPAELLQRHNDEMIALSRAKLVQRENALKAAKRTTDELELLLKADDLTGDRAACIVVTYVDDTTTTRDYRQQYQTSHPLTTMTGPQRQTLDDALQRVQLWSVLEEYQEQYKLTAKVYKKHRALPPGHMWPRLKAPNACPPVKPAAKTSKSDTESYDDVVRRLEVQAAASHDLNTLLVELSTAQASEEAAAHALKEQVEKRDLQQKQGLAYPRHLECTAECMYSLGLSVQAMDQGLVAARMHHKQTTEAVKRVRAAEQAFLAQRDVKKANNELQLYKQQLHLPASSTGNVPHNRACCG
jgi:hypothetical protein